VNVKVTYVLCGVTLKITHFLNDMYSLLINCILLRIICMSVDSSVGTVRQLEFGFIQTDVTLFIKSTNVLCYLWSTYVILLALDLYSRMLS